MHALLKQEADLIEKVDSGMSDWTHPISKVRQSGLLKWSLKRSNRLCRMAKTELSRRTVKARVTSKPPVPRLPFHISTLNWTRIYSHFRSPQNVITRTLTIYVAGTNNAKPYPGRAPPKSSKSTKSPPTPRRPIMSTFKLKWRFITRHKLTL